MVARDNVKQHSSTFNRVCPCRALNSSNVLYFLFKSRPAKYLALVKRVWKSFAFFRLRLLESKGFLAVDKNDEKL